MSGINAAGRVHNTQRVAAHVVFVQRNTEAVESWDPAILLRESDAVDRAADGAVGNDSNSIRIVVLC